MATYTAQEEQAASAALLALPNGNPLIVFITDYGAMRAADRACLASKGTTK